MGSLRVYVAVMLKKCNSYLKEFPQTKDRNNDHAVVFFFPFGHCIRTARSAREMEVIPRNMRVKPHNMVVMPPKIKERAHSQKKKYGHGRQREKLGLMTSSPIRLVPQEPFSICFSCLKNLHMW